MSRTRPRLIHSQRLPDAVAARIARDYDTPPAPDHKLTADELVALARDFRPDAVLVTSSTPVSAATVAALPDSVRVIATISVGTDHLDIPAIVARGWALTYTPDVLTDCNADLTMMLILAAARRGAEYLSVMRGGWGRSLGMEEMLGTRVTGKTLGIIGMGRIGRAVARRARGFDMKVLYSNRRRLAPDLEQGATYFSDMRDMLPHCDILTLHMPGSKGAPPVITADLLARLPRGAIFVNAARGSLVDEDALIAALSDGHLAAAGLDVYRNEPHPDPRFLALSNVFLTPHMGSATLETRTGMGMLALDNIDAVLAGGPAVTPVPV
ncbi:D-isomer specific 2-hydroxyacid dehydrogenase NAD-binding [Gluconacetobacter diazotrophicus PA1 5]|uniref:2-ketogluconate reductase n=1 Tax=Gluconacetobacter diazotrophicus (strain ATCC 49037 / DSM 5601 / CCUG 37298 / CIP 103539 / LMG 7603 / PAl5) TaxID=272568 RepID=A9H3Y4_GLUDA|nr:D-glycerate dehydrogenase [Gluconacetobacter diazotrophicus]ACI52672.1 D-isomer specific 2-hydroxyacid dehydrogenase NAD-binding [Gluconacetobacter diazotrophicus PA1 5]TWB06079.1 lactate dehydrogenase-like 2-hydroxyacid dehydrogenase [Gluconacetobacter diazotrophicus]CAP57375.1 2-ketogluconate reductase [Gluconacetobacter diazotrophicus PA1 5]